MHAGRRVILGLDLTSLTFAGLAACSLTAGAAHAQTPRSVYFYNSALGIPVPGVSAARTGPWGNGQVRTSRQVDFEGAPVLEVTTRDYQEGMRFDLSNPVDLSGYQDKGLLRLRIKFQDAAVVAPDQNGGQGGPPPAPTFLMEPKPMAVTGVAPVTTWTGAAQMGALPPIGTGAPGGFPAPPGLPGGAAPAGPPPETTTITNLKVTLIRDQGVTSGLIPINLNNNAGDSDGWHLFVLPLSAMHSTPDASGPVDRVVLTADSQDTFFVAQTALVVETGQITVSVRQPADAPGTQTAEITVKPGPLSLIADVEAGAADPDVSWNFDADNVGNLPPAAFGGGIPADAAGGGAPGAPTVPGTIAPAGAPPIPAGPTRIGAGPTDNTAPIAQIPPRIDAHGLTATFDYPNEEQNYRVEVTVRDRSGQKQPATASLLVHVRA